MPCRKHLKNYGICTEVTFMLLAWSIPVCIIRWRTIDRSCLVSLLFPIYASRLLEVIKPHVPVYADDTQLYQSFGPGGVKTSHEMSWKWLLFHCLTVKHRIVVYIDYFIESTTYGFFIHELQNFRKRTSERSEQMSFSK